MPKTRSKSTRSSARKVAYKDDSSEESSQDDLGFEMISNILGLLVQNSASKKKRRTPSKKKQSTGGCVSRCHCCNCREVPAKKSRGKGKSKQAKTPTKQKKAIEQQSKPIELDSEDEVVDTNLKETHISSIENKVDTFFKALESDDEEKEETVKPIIKKDKDFYTILSDSEDDMDKKRNEIVTYNLADVAASTSNYEPSTSGLAKSAPEVDTEYLPNSEKKPEDIFAYVDDILNEYNEVIDITDDKETSLEDVKKKTEEILGGVASLLDNLESESKKPELKDVASPPEKNTICPVCLENVGGPIQAVATMCGHIFCEPCILQVMKKAKKCPSCRKPLSKKNMYHRIYL